MHRCHVKAGLEKAARPLAAVGSLVVLDAEAAHYLVRVLRVRPGEEVAVFDGAGGEYSGTVERVRPDAVQLRVLAADRLDDRSPLAATVAQALPQHGERFETTLQKATELGADRFVPLLVRRGRPASRGVAPGRFERIVTEAARQCGRRYVPEVLAPCSVAEFVALAFEPACLRLVLHPCADARPLANVLRDAQPPPRHLVLAVGPEGGFDPEELALLVAGGFAPVHLGPRVLRTETAAPAALAVIQALVGDGDRAPASPPVSAAFTPPCR